MHIKSAKREQWEQIIAAWEDSGLSQKAFCQEHGHSHHLFGYWRKKTREDQAEYHSANGNSIPAIQLACYQIGGPASAIDPEPELETQGITVPIGTNGTVTISGRLNIGQLAKIMAACATAEPDRPQQTGAADVPT